jgi:hypothetical protein
MIYDQRKAGWIMEGYSAAFTRADFEAELAAAEAGLKTCPTRDLVLRRVVTMPLSEALNIWGSVTSDRELNLLNGMEEATPIAAE